MNSNVAVFIDPFSYHFVNDALFEVGRDRFNGENILAPWVYFRDWFVQRGIRVHTADRLIRGEVKGDRNIFVSFGRQRDYAAVSDRRDVTLSAFFAFESPVVEPQLYHGLGDVQRKFKRVYTFTDAQSLSPFLKEPLRSSIFTIPCPRSSVDMPLWSKGDRKFMVMINRNSLPAVYWNELYTERMRAVEYFSRTRDIDLYGVGWDGPSFHMGKTWLPGTVQKMRHEFLRQWQRFRPAPFLVSARRVYRGAVESKLEALSQYNFCLCFENVVLNGWITEKIFDCFIAGAIPIYWGAPDVTNFIPKECFIDMRQFAGYSELKGYLKSLTDKEIRDYRERGKAFVNSPRFRPFTKEYFTEFVARIVEEDTGIPLCNL